jgi:hypothetical protein
VPKIVEVIDGEAKINIYPRQADFLNSDCDDVLYGGAAGGGKSVALLLFALRRRIENPHTSGIIFRRTYPELEKSIIRASYEIYLPFGANYNEAKKRWTFPNGSIQEFSQCESDSDVYKYLSAEYHDMCFDEASLFNQFQISYLTSRCRSSIPGVKPLIRLASNPGGIGHGSLKARYIDPWTVHRIWFDELTGKKLTFIPAKISDNPALMEADPGYMKRLKELPEKKYLALAEGRWDVWEGQYFEGFDSRPGAAHVLDRPYRIEPNNRRLICLDWGYAEPACALWIEISPMGRLFVYRELWIDHRSPKELAHDILNMTTEDERVDYIVASPEIWGKKVELEGGGEPIQVLFESGLDGKIPMIKANNARVPGWTKTREFMMKAPDGFPWMQISPDCINLIRTIPAMIHDDHRPEDIQQCGDDHAVDSLRYGLVSVHDIPKSLITPYESGYHKIFGIKTDGQKYYSDLPQPATRNGGY